MSKREWMSIAEERKKKAQESIWATREREYTFCIFFSLIWSHCARTETLKPFEIPFYRSVGIQIIFQLTRNNSKQLSCILLIMHTGTINFQIHNEFHEWKVIRWNMSLNVHHPKIQVWLCTSSISHLLICLCNTTNKQ